jgi:hypothetical protein
MVNNKVYVGQTIKGLSHRKCDHLYKAKNGDISNYFHNALIKYGFAFAVYIQRRFYG